MNGFIGYAQGVTTISSYIHRIPITITHEITSCLTHNSLTACLTHNSLTEFSSELSTELYSTDSSAIFKPLIILLHGPHGEHSSTVACHRPHRKHMSRDRHPACSLVWWLHLQNTHVTWSLSAVVCDIIAPAQAEQTQRKHCCSIVGQACVAGVT
jgi:hypothetical protein